MKSHCWMARCKCKGKHLHLSVLGTQKKDSAGKPLQVLQLSVNTGEVGEIAISNYFNVMPFGFKHNQIEKEVQRFKKGVLKLLPKYRFARDVSRWGWAEKSKVKK